MAAAAAAGGGLCSPYLHARSMPRDSCYLQIIFFENAQTGRDTPRHGVCQPPSQQRSHIANSVRWRSGSSLLLAFASLSLFPTHAICVFMLGVSPPSEACRLPFGLTNKTPALPLK